MRDLHKALADIGDIRLRLAAGSMFRGFGPPVVASTGGIAVAAAAVQSAGPADGGDALTFVVVWSTVAVLSAALIGIEMIARTRRHHGGLADAMLFAAVDHFLPVGAAGLALAAILLTFAPDVAWLLPGLWQMLLGVGLFVVSLRFLPRAISIAGAWYFLAGATVLIISSTERSLMPWAMGIPFGIGQLLIAGILHVALGDEHVADPD